LKYSTAQHRGQQEGDLEERSIVGLIGISSQHEQGLTKGNYVAWIC